MSNYAISLKRTSLLLAALAFTAALLVANLSIFSIGRADASQLTTRNLVVTSTLSGTSTSGAADSELNGSDATHAFTFDPGSAGTIKAFQFTYCTTAIGTCTGPTGLDADSTPAVLTQQLEGVNFINSYTFSSGLSSNNVAVFVNSTGNAVTAGSTQTITFSYDDVTNPTNVGTFFVRITTYSSDTTLTGPNTIDNGTVASAVTLGVAITSRVVETLGFSTTVSDTATAEGAPACNALTGTATITLGDVTDGALSIAQAYDAYSAFRLYTNAANGVIVQYKGNTLTKGADDINAIGASKASSTVGAEQFGLGIDVNGGQYSGDTGGFGGAGQLAIDTNYNGGDGTIVNAGTAQFAYVGGTKTQIASASGFVTCDTASIRYIGNISPLTPAGTYTTTVVYYAVPTF